MALTITDELMWCSCSTCGVAIGMPASLFKARKEDRKSFFCPNGHSQAFVESDADRLRRELALTQRARDNAIASRDMQIRRAERAEKALKRAQRSAGR